MVLEDIISGTGFGNVSFTLQSPAVAAVTNPSYTTTGQGRRKRSLRAATISINTYVDPTSVYWNTGNANYNAVTLLHELGHVFDWEFGSNSTSVVYDANADGSPNTAAEAHNSSVLAACGP